MMDPCQHTIQREARFRGVGLHTGVPVSLTLKPAAENHGIRFKIAGLDESVPAFLDRVVDTRLATTIAEQGMVVSTTEHLLAALAGLGIDNALVEIDGPELPIMDGSAGPFVHILRKVRTKKQKGPRRMLKIVREFTYRDGDRIVQAIPHNGLRLTCAITFDHPLIQSQKYTFDLSPERFANEIASARTFGFVDEVRKLQDNGYALGGSLDNAVVVGEDGIMNEGGLRFSDEFVRHKILDLLGDLALFGCPVLGHVIATKSGHSQHLAFMKALLEHRECWRYVEFDARDGEPLMERLVSTTRTAGERILPFLLPPAEAFAEETCPAPA